VGPEVGIVVEGERDGTVAVLPWSVEVHLRRQLDVEDQHDTAARPDTILSGVDLEGQVLRPDPGALASPHPGHLDQDRVGGRALAVTLLEVFRDDTPILVDHEGPGEGYAVPLVFLGDVGVQNSEGSDDRRIRVGEQRVADPHARGEVAEQLTAVVADGRHSEPLGLESLE